MQRLLSLSSSSEDLSNDGFPFRCIREIPIGYARVLCARITYVGELGYELFIPAEHGTTLYTTYYCSHLRLFFVGGNIEYFLSCNFRQKFLLCTTCTRWHTVHVVLLQYSMDNPTDCVLCLYVFSAMHVYERILQAGEGLPLTHAGLKALGSLRMEKAYRDYGADMTIFHCF